MARFDFKLEKVLDVRRTRETTKQLELAETERVVLMEIERQAEITETIRKATEMIRGEREGRITGGDLMLQVNYQRSLRRQNSTQESRVKESHKAANLRREELIELNKKRKALEKLREKRKAEFDKRQAKLEQVFLDEISQRKARQVFSV